MSGERYVVREHPLTRFYWTGTAWKLGQARAQRFTKEEAEAKRDAFHAASAAMVGAGFKSSCNALVRRLISRAEAVARERKRVLEEVRRALVTLADNAHLAKSYQDETTLRLVAVAAVDRLAKEASRG
jgi:hypothetical protein